MFFYLWLMMLVKANVFFSFMKPIRILIGKRMKHIQGYLECAKNIKYRQIKSIETRTHCKLIVTLTTCTVYMYTYNFWAKLHLPHSLFITWLTHLFSLNLATSIDELRINNCISSCPFLHLNRLTSTRIECASIGGEMLMHFDRFIFFKSIMWTINNYSLFWLGQEESKIEMFG